MLDIQMLRKDKGGDPDEVRKWQRKRRLDVGLVDKVMELDAAWVESQFKEEKAREALNKANKAVAEAKKAKAPEEECKALIEKAKEAKLRVPEVTARTKELLEERDKTLSLLGNMVHEDVPDDDDEDHNAVLREWAPEGFEKRDGIAAGGFHHHELCWMLDILDTEHGGPVAGHSGYFLKGAGVWLLYALQAYGLRFLCERGFEPLYPPYFMEKAAMSRTAQLEQFDEELYKVVGDGDKYLIATAEQPISALHMKEWMEEKDLPKQYVGTSACFRKEAGHAGKETWGLFRVHQFDKIEQFVICRPEDSWEWHKKMVATSEEFLQTLGCAYRVVDIVSGALNKSAARKNDVEAWFPGYNEYKELVSASNCTDYQARSLDIRCGGKKEGEIAKRYVHMLNATLCAVQRTMACLLETYQTPEGVAVPPVLRPYMEAVAPRTAVPDPAFLKFVHTRAETLERRAAKAAADAKAQKGLKGGKAKGKEPAAGAGK